MRIPIRNERVRNVRKKTFSPFQEGNRDVKTKTKLLLLFKFKKQKREERERTRREKIKFPPLLNFALLSVF